MKPPRPTHIDQLLNQVRAAMVQIGAKGKPRLHGVFWMPWEQGRHVQKVDFPGEPSRLSFPYDPSGKPHTDEAGALVVRVVMFDLAA